MSPRVSQGWSARAPAALAPATVALLAAAGAGAWWASLGGPAARVAPAVAVAVIVAAARLSPRVAGACVLAWIPAALLLAGVPAGRLDPRGWPSLISDLVEGGERLTGIGPVGEDPSALAVALLAGGAAWIVGAALAATAPASTGRRVTAFAVLSAPWLVSVLVRDGDHTAWHGAAVLLAGLLWFAPAQRAVRPALALGLVAALVSIATAQAVGPREHWFDPQHLFGSGSERFRTLDTAFDYGPLRDRRTGATMLEITAPEPALWRMQALEVFDVRGWRVASDPSPELPEPGEEQTTVEVRVRGLRNDMVVSPGRTRRVDADGSLRGAPGGAVRIFPAPDRNSVYQVRADVVRADAAALARAPVATDPRVRAYTRLGSDSGPRLDVPPFGEPADPRVDRVLGDTPYGPVLALARRLAAGADTQLEVVERVQRYLLDGDRFRYTTDVPEPNGLPLVDFLLRERAGYCQHFAGAAALLLRLAGVPTRVVSGFATGVSMGDGRYTVRDSDAHAWIEVYFSGHGWVPFNPTPAAADAEVADGLDPLAAATVTQGRGGGALPLLVAILALVAVAVAIVRWRVRREPAQLGDLLARLAGRTGSPVRPSSTLMQLHDDLTRFGPHTAALAARAERARFAPDGAAGTTRPAVAIWRALARDLGPWRALLVLSLPAFAERIAPRAHSGPAR